MRARRPARFAFALLLGGLLPLAACAAPPATDAYGEQRLALVRSIEARGIRDSATLAAIRSVPRHEFVPAASRKLAYSDEALRIEHGQTISQPFIVAFMTEAIRPRPGMKVLEVGTGSGYQAAVLAHAGCRVHTIEIVRALADSARARLQRLGYGTVRVRHADGYRGWPEAAPFDAIVVTAAPDSMPRALVDQLAIGGRLVVPVGPENEVQSLKLLEKTSHGTVTRELLPVRFVPMRHGER